MRIKKLAVSRVSEHLRLAAMLAKRDLKTRYVSSYAGVAWNIVVPLLYAVINVIVFSILMTGRMGDRYGNIPFALFYFVPFSLWMFFSDVVIRSTRILAEYSYLINKIAFPFWVLPLIPMASALLSQFVIIVLVGGLMAYYGVAPASSAGFYLLIWLICALLTMGFAYAVSAVAVYVPDLVQIVPVGINIVFWLTPILYPATLVEQGGSLWARALIVECNPFSYIVELSRHAVFGSAPILWELLVVLGGVAILVLVIGVLVFRKLKPGFADVI